MEGRKKIVDIVISVLMLSATAGIILLPQFSLLRSVTEYSAHLMLLFLALAMVFMFADRSRPMLAALTCTAALAIWLKNASNWDLKLPVVNEEIKLKVAHINLSNIYDNFDELDSILISKEIDIISFQELTPDWDYVLHDEMTDRYPYAYSNVRIDPYGIALYSKLPLLKTDTLLCNNIPSLVVDIKKGQEQFHLVSSYLTPALDNQSSKMASAQLDRVIKDIKQCDQHVIALGEYNMVYWTQEIRSFRAEAELKNSRRDIAQGNLRVPYDHIFFSEGLECIQFDELKSKSQSHLGITGTYQIKKIIKNPERSWSLN